MIAAFVINLDSRPDRLLAQSRQLDRLGIPWTRIAAATPETVSPPPEDAYWRRWERPLRDVEKAAHASHREVWERIAGVSAPQLVLEDDALLLGGAGALLASLEGLAGIDHVSLETRGRRKSLGPRHPDAPIRRLWQDRSGAAAYVLWPRGAERLLDRAAGGAGLADATICAAYELSSWQAWPAQAIQFDQCARWGLDPPVSVASAISSVDRPRLSDLPPAEARAYRLRRARAQVRMAARLLAHPFSEHAEVPPDLDREAPEMG